MNIKTKEKTNIKNSLTGMTKKYKKYLIIIFSIILGFTFTTAFAIEKITYNQSNMLEPGVFGGTKTDSLKNYIGGMFDLLIAIAVVLAVVMIIIGGFEYMTTDSWQKHSQGIERIKDALIGLGLALVAYIILWTINPCLVDFTKQNGCEQINTLLQVQE